MIYPAWSSIEMQAAIIGAIVGAISGAVFTYLGGFLLAQLDRNRQRKAVATALLYELDMTQRLAEDMKQHELPANVTAYLSVQSLEKFVDYAPLFKPKVVVVLMEVVRHAKDLLRELSSEKVDVRQANDELHEVVKDLAEYLIADAKRAKPLLVKAGGIAPVAEDDTKLPPPPSTPKLSD